MGGGEPEYGVVSELSEAVGGVCSAEREVQNVTDKQDVEWRADHTEPLRSASIKCEGGGEGTSLGCPTTYEVRDGRLELEVQKLRTEVIVANRTEGLQDIHDGWEGW